MNINDHKVKSLIRIYLEETEETDKVVGKFKKEVELYVYNFPRLAYRKSKDICSDFYLYVMERLETMMRNYPLEEDLKFKTWFNYVLKNQFLNFMYYSRKEKIRAFNIEDYEDVSAIMFEEPEESDYEDLRKGISTLKPVEQSLLKLYYMPEIMKTEDVFVLTKEFKMSVQKLLSIQHGLIEAHYEQIKSIRRLSDKIQEINQKLMRLKYELYQYRQFKQALDLKTQSDLMNKIARLEVSKNKVIREFNSPNKKLFHEFTRIFQDPVKARNRLNIVKRKLKFEIIQIVKHRREHA